MNTTAKRLRAERPGFVALTPARSVYWTGKVAIGLCDGPALDTRAPRVSHLLPPLDSDADRLQRALLPIDVNDPADRLVVRICVVCVIALVAMSLAGWLPGGGA